MATRQRTITRTREQHGMYKTRIYSIWDGIKQRCYNTNNPNYRYYGGRGIKMYEPWRISFTAFFNYVGEPPSPAYSIDRWPDNNGNYEPGNVRWATKDQQ